MQVKNTGLYTSDEVVQIYAKAPASRAKKPVRQLIAFERLHDLAPGESREITLKAPVDELRFFDVVSGRLMVEEGCYRFFVDYDAKQTKEVFIPGEKTGKRVCNSSVNRIPAEYYDAYSNFRLTKGNLGHMALYVNEPEAKAWAEYRDCQLEEGMNTLFMHMKSVYGVKVEVLLDGKVAGSFEGNTKENSRYECNIMDKGWAEERKIRDRLREPIFEDFPIKLNEPVKENGVHTLSIIVDGEVKFSSFYFGTR